MSEYVHIVCLDAPSPPDYGGAIDMYYKITSLYAIGKKIILHYFNYRKNRNANDLEQFCSEVHVYDRRALLISLLTLRPHIVSSRISFELVSRLNKDKHPVILEGIHCTGIIPYLNSERKIIVRVHNNEAGYYHFLGTCESNFLKKIYFFYDSVLLRRYQKKLPKQPTYAFISTIDKEIFKENYDLPNQSFIPSFMPWHKVLSKTGRGRYCLYHGNLSVSENKKAALWLVENILPRIDLPLIIAGRQADALNNKLVNKDRVYIVNNPSDTELTNLIQEAHINLLPSMNHTGVKLKLLHSLFEGRFCISNYKGIAGSGIEEYVTSADTVDDWIEAIQQKNSIEVTAEFIETRKNILSVYNNALNAKKLNALL